MTMSKEHSERCYRFLQSSTKILLAISHFTGGKIKVWLMKKVGETMGRIPAVLEELPRLPTPQLKASFQTFQ